MGFPPFGGRGIFPHFGIDSGHSRVDSDQLRRAFEVEVNSSLESEPYLIYGLTSMLHVRREIELIDIPIIRGLTFNPVSIVRVPWVKLEPTGPYSLKTIGRPVSMLWTFSTEAHESVHLEQIMHKSLLDAYILSERAINRFRRIIRDGKCEEILEILRNLIILTEAGIYFNPLKIEEDKLSLLEFNPLFHQLSFLQSLTREIIDIREELANLKLVIGVENLKKLREQFLSNVIKSKYHRDAFKFSSQIRNIASDFYGYHKLRVLFFYHVLICYLDSFTDFGKSDALKLFEKIKNDHNILRYIKEIESEEDIIEMEGDLIIDEIGTGSLSSDLERYVGERLNFYAYRSGVLEEITECLENLEGFSQGRVKTLKEAIERSERPSQFINEVRKWIIVILKDQDSRLYLRGHNIVEPQYASLMLSFYSDLYICTNILNSVKKVFREGGDPWEAMEEAIVCPFRNAPQMKCVNKNECEHERPWLDAVVTRRY